MKTEERRTRRRRGETFRKQTQKVENHACRREEQEKHDPVVAVWIQTKPREEYRRYGLTRERTVPIGDIQAVKRVKKFGPAPESMRHIEQRIALKEVREAVGKEKVFKNAERQQKCNGR